MLLLVDTLGTGGAERYVVTVSNWLAAHGCDVSVAAAPGELRETLSAGVTFVPIPLEDRKRGVPGAIWEVRALMRTRRPAAIVTNSLLVTWLARAASGVNRVPIVAVAHGWPDPRYQWVGPLLGIADKVAAVSPEVMTKLVDAGLDAARCKVILNGVDCTTLGPRSGPVRTAARAAMGAGPTDLLVVNLGRLTAQKAQQHVLPVAARLRESHPHLRYAIVGPGPRAGELEALVRDHGLGDRIRLLGLREDIPDLLGSADIYLSCSDWEGMPLSTIEAMASGLPAVVTRTEGSSLLVTPSCGVIVPVGDSAAMADAVGRLASDPKLRARMGEAARLRALASFGHDRMVRELVALVTEAAAPTPETRRAPAHPRA